MNPTIVVNVYRDEYDIYIGRPGKGQDGTFGNPFKDGERQENIENFRIYFYDKIKNDPEFKNKVHALKGKRLGCFCKPKHSCHGDIIADYLNNLEDNDE